MKTLKLMQFFILVCNLSIAQTPAVQWQKSLGSLQSDYGRAVIEAKDGNYIIAGAKTTTEHQVIPNSFSLDCYIAKLSPQGIVIWEKSIGGSANDDIYDVEQTTDGGYILTGNTGSNDGDLIKNQGWLDAWVIKLDSLGNMEWQKTFGGTSVDKFASVKSTKDGGYILAGMTNSNDGDVSENHGGGDFWIVRLDVAGNLLWQKTFGGSSTENASDIDVLDDGGFIVAGVAQSQDGDLSINRGEGDCWIVRLDGNGIIQWQKTFGGSLNDRAEAIKLTTDGGFVFAGTSSSNNGDLTTNNGDIDCWVVKLDVSGNIQWQKSFGGSGWDYANSIGQIGKSYLIAGNNEVADGDVLENHGVADCWMFKIDSLGRMEWQKSFGGTKSESASDIIQAADGCFVAVGYGQSNDFDVADNNGQRDIWIIKLAFDNTICPNSSAIFTADNSNPDVKYQWQVNKGAGFANVDNDIFYSGTDKDTLIITSTASEWYGYQYQCLIIGNQLNYTTTPFTLKFANKWIGHESAAWENAANWSCGSLPDSNTDVIIADGTVQINSNVICRSLTVNPSATVKVNTGYSIKITH